MKRKKHSRTCFRCGKAFSTNRAQQIYCSAYCRHNKRNFEPKKCAYCGLLFAPRGISNRYCSKNCLQRVTAFRIAEQAKHKANNRPPKKRRCLVCEAVYIVTGGGQKYCSKKCAKIVSEKKRKEQEKAHIRNGTGSNWLKLRFMVLRRDNFTCQYCGKTIQDGVKLHIDHIKPKSKKGQWAIGNLITACYECNTGKHDVLLSEREQRKLKSKIRVL